MDDDVYRKRLLLYSVVRFIGVGFFLLGVAIAYTGIVRPGGAPQFGAIVAILGRARCRPGAAVAQEKLGHSGQRARVKRFWKDVAVEPKAGGWAVELDGRPVRTPARAPLMLPTEALAQAVAEEWRSVEGDVDPRTMPLSGLANAAIDRVSPDRQAFADGLARYAETDFACYRADGPRELVAREEESWDALLAWARRRFDVDFATTSGVVHVPQPPATVERLSHAVAVLDAFHLAGLSPLVTVGGSLVAALAVLEKAMTADAAWEAVSIDERWQLEQWGADAEAQAALDNRKRDFLAGAQLPRRCSISSEVGRSGRGRSRRDLSAARALNVPPRRLPSPSQGRNPCRGSRAHIHTPPNDRSRRRRGACGRR